jgi:hypothetical protein
MEYMEIKNNPNLTMEEIALDLLRRSCESARTRCRSGKGRYKNVKCDLTPRVLRDLLKQKESFWKEWVRLTEKWVKHGYCEKDRPTLDRINKDGHYEINNLQALAHKANSLKANAKKCALLVYNDSYQIVEYWIILGVERVLKILGIPRSKAGEFREGRQFIDYLIFIDQSEAVIVDQELSKLPA